MIRESKADNPLVPLRMFRSRNVSGANAISALSVAGMFGMFFIGALYLEQVLGYSALEIGLGFLPCTVGMGVLSLRYTETLITRFGASRLLAPGLALIATGLALFALAPVDANYVQHILPSAALLGLGAGIAMPALMTVAMSGATPEDAGLASGLVNTTTQMGAALGLAVLATVSSSRTEGLAAAGESAREALTGGFHVAFLVGAALVVAGIVVALVVTRSEAPAAAEAAPPAPERLPAHVELSSEAA